MKSSVVKEFDQASKGLKLPKYSTPKAPSAAKQKRLKFNFLDKMKEFK